MLWSLNESVTAKKTCSLYKQTFIRAEVFLQEEKINLSAGFPFLCAHFNSPESWNASAGGQLAAAPALISAESWSTAQAALSQGIGQGGRCWERLWQRGDTKAGFGVRDRAALTGATTGSPSACAAPHSQPAAAHVWAAALLMETSPLARS